MIRQDEYEEHYKEIRKNFRNRTAEEIGGWLYNHLGFVYGMYHKKKGNYYPPIIARRAARDELKSRLKPGAF